MQTLTSRQQQIFAFIQRCCDDQGMPPTRAEIAAFMGFRSVNAAEDHLRALARKGAISLSPGTSRGIRLLAGQHGDGALPVVGNVAAGAPILAQEHISEHLRIGADAFRPRAQYLLRVRGMSMRDAGILDGDLLAVHPTRDASRGQTIVARVNDEVTVKRFERRGNRVRLHSANPDFDTIEVNLKTDEFVVEGLGVGIVRAGLGTIRTPRHRLK